MYRLHQDRDSRECCWGFTAHKIHSQKSARWRLLIQLSQLFALKFSSGYGVQTSLDFIYSYSVEIMWGSSDSRQRLNVSPTCLPVKLTNTHKNKLCLSVSSASHIQGDLLLNIQAVTLPDTSSPQHEEIISSRAV